MGSRGAVVQAEDGGGPKVVKRQTSAREVLEPAGRLSPPPFSVHGRGGRIHAGARAAAEAMVWRRELAGRAGPRRAVGLAVELPRAVLRAGELLAAVAGRAAPQRASRPSARGPPLLRP